MGIIAGKQDFGVLSPSSAASNGEWVKFGLVYGRPRYFVNVLEPISSAVLPQSATYQSFTRLINMPYEISFDGVAVKRGYIRSINDSIFVPSHVMKSLNLLDAKFQIDSSLPFSSFGLQIWKPVNQELKVGYYGMIYG